MDVREVVKLVAAIEEMKGDSEIAHGREDELYRDVLAHIAGHNSTDGILAQAALEARKIDFPRWTA